jgi:hypothetical protein
MHLIQLLFVTSALLEAVEAVIYETPWSFGMSVSAGLFSCLEPTITD